MCLEELDYVVAAVQSVQALAVTLSAVAQAQLAVA